MKFNIEKLKQIARPMTETERQEINYREDNRGWLSLSAKFALSVRHILRTKGISQRVLAERMAVSPSQITKILSGKENLSLQTIAKVEKALGLSIVQIIPVTEDTAEDYTAYESSELPSYKLSIPVVDYASDCIDDTYPNS